MHVTCVNTSAFPRKPTTTPNNSTKHKILAINYKAILVKNLIRKINILFQQGCEISRRNQQPTKKIPASLGKQNKLCMKTQKRQNQYFEHLVVFGQTNQVGGHQYALCHCYIQLLQCSTEAAAAQTPRVRAETPKASLSPPNASSSQASPPTYPTLIEKYAVIDYFCLEVLFILFILLSVFYNVDRIKRNQDVIIETFVVAIKQMSNQGQKSKLKGEREGVSKLLISKDRNWTDHELIQLSAFMIHHIDKFQREQQRRESKVYAVLSKYIATRNINQCRNYVNKLIRKFKSHHQIVNFFKLSLHNYDDRFREESIKVQKIIFPLKSIQKEMKRMSTYNDEMEQNIYSEDQSMSLRECSLEDQIKHEFSSNQKELKPTDVGYYEADYSPKREESKSDIIRFVQRERGCDQPSNFSQRKSSILDLSYFQCHQWGQQREQDKSWKDCHQMFFDWALKATSLIEKYAIQPPYLHCSS